AVISSRRIETGLRFRAELADRSLDGGTGCSSRPWPIPAERPVISDRMSEVPTFSATGGVTTAAIGSTNRMPNVDANTKDRTDAGTRRDIHSARRASTRIVVAFARIDSSVE